MGGCLQTVCWLLVDVLTWQHVFDTWRGCGGVGVILVCVYDVLWGGGGVSGGAHLNWWEALTWQYGHARCQAPPSDTWQGLVMPKGHHTICIASYMLGWGGVWPVYRPF